MKKIRMDGYVGFEIDSKSFAEELKSAAGDDIEISINSAGGDVFPAFDIFSQMREYPGNVTIKLGGIVASAATIIAAGADKIIASPITSFMVHNAMSAVYGDYRDHKEASDLLRRFNQMLATRYAELTGKTEKEIFAMMDAETWLFGTEIKDNGFAHEMAEGESSEISNMSEIRITAKTSYEDCIKKLKENPLRAKDILKENVKAIMDKPKKEKQVDRTEALNFLKADMKPAEIAAAFNLELADKAKESELASVKAENDSLKKIISEKSEKLRQEKIKAMYPGKDSPVAAYLLKITEGKDEKEVQAIFDGLKDDPIAKAIDAQLKDQDSPLNIIDKPAGDKKADNAATSGIVKM